MEAGRIGKRVLVTGADGFAGDIVAQYLQENGFQVTGTVHKHLAQGNFRTIACNLAEPWSIEGDFDAIVHTAGSLPYQHPTMLDYKQCNIDTMQNLVEFARRTGVGRIINFSTIGIYGDFQGSTAVNEVSPRVNPDGYGLSKYMAECMLRESGLINISLRMPGLLGIGARPVWFTNTVEKFRRGEQVRIYAPDFQTKNFVWLPDLAAFVSRLLTMSTWPHDRLVLACRESISIRELVNEMKRLTGAASEIVVSESERPPFCLDPTRALAMGYKSLTPQEIVREYIEGLDKYAN